MQWNEDDGGIIELTRRDSELRNPKIHSVNLCREAVS